MVEIGFYALSVLAVSMVLVLLRNHPDPWSLTRRYLLILLIWTIYIILIADTELISNFDLPPRLPLLIVVPAIVIILILTSQKSLRTVIQKTSLYLPVFLQSFRILVELLIYATFVKGIFPQSATFEGLNYDIVVGVSSIFIGFAVLKERISLKGIMIWNIISLCILLVTVYSFVSAYYFTDFVLTGDGRKFIELPYLLLPSYLLPMAVFLHVYSIKQVMVKFKS